MNFMNKFILIEHYKTYKILNITLKFKKSKLAIVSFLKATIIARQVDNFYNSQLWLVSWLQIWSDLT